MCDRSHKLFIVTSGGCSNLSDKFYNCSVDIRGSSMTAEDVLHSEEAYYLRRINGRNNARCLGPRMFLHATLTSL